MSPLIVSPASFDLDRLTFRKKKSAVNSPSSSAWMSMMRSLGSMSADGTPISIAPRMTSLGSGKDSTTPIRALRNPACDPQPSSAMGPMTKPPRWGGNTKPRRSRICGAASMGFSGNSNWPMAPSFRPSDSAWVSIVRSMASRPPRPPRVKPNPSSILGRKCTPMTMTIENGAVPTRPIAVMPILVNCRSRTPPYSFLSSV